MNRLTLHISYLLKHNDCVIVPGLGAFLVSETPAYIDRDTLKIHPSARKVHFNSLIIDDDGLLAHSVARKERIPHSTAEQEIADDVAILKENLRNNKSIAIPGIGTLRMQLPEASLLFTPAKAEPLYPSVNLMPATPSVAKEGNAPERPFSDKYYYIPVSKTFVHVAASIALVVGLAMACIIPNRHQIASMQQAAIISTLTINEPSETADEAPTLCIALPEEEEAPQAEIEAAPAHPYYLIVAAAKSDANIEKFIARHKNSSYKLALAPGKGMKKVYAAASENREDLVKIMQSEAFKAEFGDTWIYSTAEK